MSEPKVRIKVFEGCRRPELIEKYIEGVKDGAKESTLKALTKEVEELAEEVNGAINSQKGEGRHVPNWLKGQNHAYVNVLEIINNHLDNDSTN